MSQNQPTSKLEIFVTPEDKARWVRAAQANPAKAGPGLANWVIEKLNQVSNEVSAKAKDKTPSVPMLFARSDGTYRVNGKQVDKSPYS